MPAAGRMLGERDTDTPAAPRPSLHPSQQLQDLEARIARLEATLRVNGPNVEIVAPAGLSITAGSGLALPAGAGLSLVAGQAGSVSCGSGFQVSAGMHVTLLAGKAMSVQTGTSLAIRCTENYGLVADKAFTLQARNEVLAKTVDASLDMKKDGTVRTRARTSRSRRAASSAPRRTAT